MYYIQRKDGRTLETVDEFPTETLAYNMLREYRISDSSAVYYVSRRACRDWKK